MKKIIQYLLMIIVFLSSHALMAQEICDDNKDNDGDGLIDCQDPDCPSCVSDIQCEVPYRYYMPPMFGVAGRLILYNNEDFVISTLGRTANVTFLNSSGTVLGTATIPTTHPVSVKMNGTAGSTGLVNQLPKDLILVKNELRNTILSDKGVIIESSEPLQIIYRLRAKWNQDILQLQGQASLGRSFYPSSQTDSQDTGTDQYERHFVSVMATEDDTDIEFKIPPGNDVCKNNGSFNPIALPADRKIKVTLDQGQSYMISTLRSKSVTGILVTSDKDIVVNSGSQHSNNQQGGDSDAGFQQLVPTQALENTYIAIDGGNVAAPDYLVIVSIENNTNITINGVSGGVDGLGNPVPTTLNAGDSFTYFFKKDDQFKPYLVNADNRLYVYHASSYNRDEYGMDILPPINNCVGSLQIDFLKELPSRALITVPTAGLPSLKLNGRHYSTYGSAQLKPITGSSYSAVIIDNADIQASNRVTCNRKFHLGVTSGEGTTGNYAFYSNYEKSIEILDPVTLLPISKYEAGQVTPGVPVDHCLIISGCGSINTITSATASGWDTANPSTKGKIVVKDGCINYTMDPAAPACAKETVTLRVENEFGISKQVCVRFENITKPFSITPPSNSFICSVGSPTTSTIDVNVNVPSGSPAYTWVAPDGSTVTPTNTGVAPNFKTSINANLAGFYQLTVTVGTCSQTIDVRVVSKNCNDNDGDGIADNLDPDDDNDGILDVDEQNGDPKADADGDGIPNHLDLDSDNDGIPDIIEVGGEDTNGDGIIDDFVDTDGDGIDDGIPSTGLGTLDTDGDGVPNYLDLDSDNDGISDLTESGGEDVDGNGIVDNASDSNGNGYSDLYDSGLTGIPLLVTGADTNSDGKANSYPEENNDNDAVPNFLDLDSDNDGITDLTEEHPTLEGATVDGMVDGTDTDGDGIINVSGIDVSGFGGDFSEPKDKDSDSIPNYLDIDADNDGIVDNIEGQPTDTYVAPTTDTDGDGLNDAYDNNIGTFGGSGVKPENTDNKDEPDYLDEDSDNDGEDDIIEGWDTNGNGVIDGSEKKPTGTDADGDGLDDGYDADNSTVNPTNGTTPASYPKDASAKPSDDRDWRQAPDNDGDGIADIDDLDDDNDGILDTEESGGNDPLADADGDGTPDYKDPDFPGFVDSNGDGINDNFDTDKDGIIDAYDLDSDNDGISDVVESGGDDPDNDGIVGTGTPTVNGNGQVEVGGSPVANTDRDTDGDGIPDSKDLDTDNDGVPDVIEAGGVDTNGDGLIDNIVDKDEDGMTDQVKGGLPLVDTDGDGVPNVQDLDSDNDGLPDVIEVGGTDADNDGKVDGFVDADKDGFSDPVETTPLITTGADTDGNGTADSYPVDDFDGDGKIDMLDIDSDDDGIIDFVESGLPDTDSDGKPDGTVGSDGWSDEVDALAGPLIPANNDGDANPDHLDIDADNDGIVDNIEGQPTTGYKPPTTDTDGDGLNDAYDDNIGTFGGSGITPTNTDSIDEPDYLDLDADNDGINDVIEGWDTDADGVANTTPTGVDADGDGLDDGFDSDNTTANPTNGTTPASYPDVDKPGKDRDWRELENDPPVAEDDKFVTDFQTPISGTVATNDSDPNKDPLHYTPVDITVAEGTLTIDKDGNFTFKPADGYTGTFCYTYEVKDNHGASATAKLCIEVKPNNPPTPQDDKEEMEEGEDVVEGTLADNDSDPDSDDLIYTGGTFPTDNGGTFEIKEDGTFTYTPAADFVGEDCYEYTVCDDKGNCAKAKVCVTVPEGSLVKIPEGFSPNGDGINDTFVVSGTRGREFTLKIYNRWGNVVYDKENYKNDWAGTSNVGIRVGDDLPDGTYFYVIVFRDGEKYAKYLTLKR